MTLLSFPQWTRWAALLATETKPPVCFESLLLSIWRAAEGNLEFRYQFLHVVWQIKFFSHSPRHDLQLAEGSDAAQIVLASPTPFLRQLGAPLCNCMSPASIAEILIARELENEQLKEGLPHLFFLDPKTREHVNPKAVSILKEMGYCKSQDLLKTWWTRLDAGDPLRLEIFAVAETGLDIYFIRSLPQEVQQKITAQPRLPHRTFTTVQPTQLLPLGDGR